ncbi:hypothetical protein DVH02_04465 [Streptomyces corynorhini]|uniref:Uncharacterized protein n=1 Tax=Streptomyces corynorhini TaxID=2282652 RepID=A0A370BC22_9ACTN|nr:hypothetical protein DVH02_04465 [Streptomyces corynorhini]
MTLVVGVIVLALLLLLATCGGKQTTKSKAKGTDVPRTTMSNDVAARAPRLTVPAAFDTKHGWDIPDGSTEYAIAEATNRIAYLERVGNELFRLRTLNPATGKYGWEGEAWRPLFTGDRFPRLLSVSKDGQDYFVTWSYGKLSPQALKAAESIVSLDVYDAASGQVSRVEVPWTDAPVVTADGPGIVISDGKATSAVVDPATAEVVKVPPGSLGYPKGCGDCRKLTQVRAMTDKGLLISGAREFWVRGGWYSRKVAPKEADPASGIPASMAGGYLLAKWQPKKGSKEAGTHDLWVLHDVAKGKAVIQVRCRKPAIKPVDDPRLVTSPGGQFLIAGRLAFDLDEKLGYCFEESDGTEPLTLTTVSDDGTAYGAISARSTADAMAGGGRPVRVDLKNAAPAPLAANVRLPSSETMGVGVFRWTDGTFRTHLIGYPRLED